MSGDHNMNQKPVAWFHADNYKTRFTTDPSQDMIGRYWQPLYTAPRQWVGLAFDELPDHEFGNRDFILGARWAEAKLKEKNAA
jgi:hypothetical protein